MTLPHPVSAVANLLLNPNAVIVVGASAQPHKVGGRPIHYLRKYGFTGQIYPVNPSRSEIQGLRAYAAISDVPQAADVAVISLPAEQVLDAINACGTLGTKIAVVYSSGFGETGAAGVLRQQQLVAAARRHGMRIMGPNAQGPASLSTGAVLNFSTVFNETSAKSGPIAIVSQSGGAGAMAYGYARDAGLGVSYCIATGNDADLSVADMIDAVRERGDAKVVLLYLESIVDAIRLERAAERAITAGMHILALKSGRSAAGSAAAASHTGALMTDDDLFTAYLERLGIRRVDTLRQAVESLPLYLCCKRILSRAAVFVSHSGAMGVMAADSAERHGLALAPLAADTTERLRQVLPSFGTPMNPVDLTAAAMTEPDLLESALVAVSAQADLGAVIVGVPVAGAGYDLQQMAQSVRRINEGASSLVVAAIPQSNVRAIFEEHGVTCFHDEDAAIESVSAYFSHMDLESRRRSGKVQGPLKAETDTGEVCLSEHESLGWLAQAGLPVVRRESADHPEDAVRAWRRIGAPVAVKGNSALAPHKTEMGLVALDLHDEATVRSEAERMLGILRAIGECKPEVTVAEMVRGRIELAIGARRHPTLGLFIMIGAGGKYIEALDDTVTLSAPFSTDDVLCAIEHLRIYPLMRGVRGDAPLDLEALARMAQALSERLASADARNIQSVDINPVVMGGWRPAVMVDALLTISVPEVHA